MTPIAVSHLRDQQEAMLLMRAGDWVEPPSDSGSFECLQISRMGRRWNCSKTPL